MMDKAVWFITGASSGLGLELAKHLLDSGYRVVLGVRRPESLADLVAQFDGRILVLTLDVTERATIKSAVAEAISNFDRIDWAGRSIVESPIEIEDYADTSGKCRSSTKAASGNQPGDPARASVVIRAAVELAHPPLRLLLGGLALDLAYKRLEALKKNFDAWSEVTRSADFP